MLHTRRRIVAREPLGLVVAAAALRESSSVSPSCPLEGASFLLLSSLFDVALGSISVSDIARAQ